MAAAPDTALVWLRDLTGAIIAPLVDIDALSAEDRLGDASDLAFTLRADHPLAELLVPDQLVDYDGRSWRIRELDQRHDRGKATIEVKCDPRWMDLGRKIRFGNYPLLALTAQAGLVQILKSSGWAAGPDPDVSDVTAYSVEGYDDSLLTHVRRWADIVGYELEFDDQALTVALVEAVGVDRGVGFRYGSNLAGFRRRYEPPAATVLYPVGANDLTVADVNPSGELYIEDFSWYIAQGLTLTQARTLHTKQEAWLDNRFLGAVNLLDAATRRLADLAQPIISYECSVVDLADATGAPTPVDVGDVVRVYDETFGIDIETRVVRRISRPLEPAGDEVELAYLRPTFAYGASSSSRTPNYAAVAILVDASEAATVTAGAVDYAAIALNSTGSASTAVTGSTFVGTASGAGDIAFTLIVDNVDIGDDYVHTFADGELVEFSAPSYVADLGEGAHVVLWRAQVIAGAGTVAVNAGAARGWVLTTGAYGLGIDTSPNRRLAEEQLLTDYGTAGAFSAVLNTALVGLSAETFTLTPHGFVETYRFPFIIGDPEFGVLDGVGVLT